MYAYIYILERERERLILCISNRSVYNMVIFQAPKGFLSEFRLARRRTTLEGAGTAQKPNQLLHG